MLDSLTSFFESTSFMAHGYCLTWRSDLILLHAVSDGLIFLSYFVIPLIIFYFVSRRTDLAHKGVFWLFAAFILACGATHLIGLVTLWSPIYGVEGVVKGATAGISALTAVAAWLAVPHALRLPSPAMLRETNQRLLDEIIDHEQTNGELTLIRAELEQRVAARTQELEAKASELEIANQNLRQFAHIASHDLQEPLRKIASYIDLLEHSLAEGNEDELAHSLDRIKSSSRRARAMISDMLRYSKMKNRAPELEPAPIRSVVSEAAEVFEYQVVERGGRLEIDLPDAVVELDVLFANQIFQNLIGNAFKYVPETRAPVVRIVGETTGGRLTLRISDNGIGFNPQLKAKVFEPFARAHPSRIADGSGIGLAVVAEAVRLMGWRIEIDTVEGEGTEVTLEIPLGTRPAGGETDESDLVPA